MDFTKSEMQVMVEGLAQKIFREQVSDDYHKARRSEHEGYDMALWGLLAESGLLNATVAEEFGGSAMSFLEASPVLEAQGAVLAILPLWQTVVASLFINNFGSQEQKQLLLPDVARGKSHFAVAFAEAARSGLPRVLSVEEGTVTGVVDDVAFAKDARAILLPLCDENGPFIYLLDAEADSLTMELQVASNHEPHYRLQFEGLRIDSRFIVKPPSLEVDLFEWLLQHSYTAIAALQLGVVQDAIKRTAAYVSERKQFNRPLASFQAVGHRAADGYIDYSSLRACVWLAAWRLSVGLDATTEARSAKWWACEAGHRIGHTAQHLHGGLGADIDYPIHRYFLWAKQLEYTLGGAQEQLAQLGEKLAEHDHLGLEV